MYLSLLTYNEWAPRQSQKRQISGGFLGLCSSAVSGVQLLQFLSKNLNESGENRNL
jgi:hypothetical protein